MKIKFLALLLFFPIACFAQLKTLEIKEKTGVPIKIFREPILEEAVIVFIYAPTLDDIKFKATQGWITGTEPKYDQEKYRWELYLPINVRNEIRVNSKGFNEATIVVPPSLKSQISYEMFEKNLNVPPKLTIRANPPDAKISIWSHPQGERIAEGTLVAGTYVVDRLSAGTVRVLLAKEGYSSKDELLTLKNGDELQKDWELEPLVKLVEIKSTPSGANIFLNEQRDQPIGTTPFYNNLPATTKKLTITKEYYKDTTVVVNLKERTNFSVNLSQKSSKVRVAESGLYKISINDVYLPFTSGYFTYEVPMGESRKIKVERKNYKPFEKSYPFVNENDNLEKLKSEWQTHFKLNSPKNTTQKTVSFIVGLAGIGSGLYLMQSANKNYEAYKNATNSSEAASLRKQVESADRLFPIALGVGGVFTGIGVVFLIK